MSGAATAARAPFDQTLPSQVSDAVSSATVASVTSDSRDVTSGSVFVALQGFKTDGVEFARDAIARGAIAVVAEAPAAIGGNWFDS